MALAVAVAVGTGSLRLRGLGPEGTSTGASSSSPRSARPATRCADAGSTATIGPNLDAAFGQARAVGMDPQTIAGVVKAQVDNPRPSTTNPSVSMPAGLLSGTDLDDVASYIGEVAGNPKFKGPQLPNLPGALVFSQNNCAGCHTMQAAGASGTTGPNLDA